MKFLVVVTPPSVYHQGRVLTLGLLIPQIPPGMVSPFMFGWDYVEGLFRTTGGIFFTPGPGASEVSGRVADFATSSIWQFSATPVTPDKVVPPQRFLSIQ